MTCQPERINRDDLLQLHFLHVNVTTRLHLERIVLKSHPQHSYLRQWKQRNQFRRDACKRFFAVVLTVNFFATWSDHIRFVLSPSSPSLLQPDHRHSLLAGAFAFSGLPSNPAPHCCEETKTTCLQTCVRHASVVPLSVKERVDIVRIGTTPRPRSQVQCCVLTTYRTVSCIRRTRIHSSFEWTNCLFSTYSCIRCTLSSAIKTNYQNLFSWLIIPQITISKIFFLLFWS